MIQSFDTGITDIKIRELAMDELRSKLDKEVFHDIMNKLRKKMENDNMS